MMNALQGLASWSVYGIPAFLFLITVVVFFHELGHFSVARFFGVRIETFSIGFGPAIVKWKDRQGTLWKISWIPLGGFVKFFGDADGASTPDREGVARMSAEERAVAFPFKPLYQRALIVVAGPVANFILAMVILTGLFMIHGQVIVPPVVGKVDVHSAAAAAGIRTGDRIVSIDGTAIESFLEIQQIVALSAGQRLPVELDRGKTRLTVWATPRLTEVTDPFKNKQEMGDLGIAPPMPPVVDSLTPGSPAEAAGIHKGDRIVSIGGHAIAGVDDIQQVVSANAGRSLAIALNRDGTLLTVHAAPRRDSEKKVLLGLSFQTPRTVKYLGPVAAVGAAGVQIGQIITTTFKALTSGPAAAKQVSGIIGIAKMSGQVAAVSFVDLILLAALLSVSIGLVNLFPIPLLDGGHLLYYACEGVLGRPLGERAQDVGFRLGLAVVLGIFLLATWNDLVRLNLF
ncbi:MAG TPA: RIP metalloprotease RseP [Rhizomicrobium sp.]